MGARSSNVEQDNGMNHDTQNDDSANRTPRIRSRLIHGAQHTGRWDYNHHVVPPMTASATFRLESAERGVQGFVDFVTDERDPKDSPPIYIYDRLDEPTRGMLEDNLAAAEGGEIAACFASGMAAISTALGTLCAQGDNVVCHNVLYGCTYSLVTQWLPRFGINHRLVDMTNPAAVQQAISPETRVIYFETPVNPDLKIIDIGAVRTLIDESNEKRPQDRRIRLVVDNTFATPFCQRPLQLGADVVCQSLTKAIGGFGTDIGGALIGPRELHRDWVLFRKDFGGSLSPKSAWPVLVHGLPTLSTRMINYQKSAMKVARFLQDHPGVKRVCYPGLPSFPQYELAKKQMIDYRGKFAPGSMLYFELQDPEGNGAPAARFVNWAAQHAYALTLAVSLGQIKTLIEAPFHMTHATMPDEEKRRFGLAPSGIRLSLGLEDWHDIIADLETSLHEAAIH